MNIMKFILENDTNKYGYPQIYTFKFDGLRIKINFKRLRARNVLTPAF